MTEEQLSVLAEKGALAYRRYVSQPDESGLLDAYELGRTALVSGLGVLEMAHVLSAAVAGGDDSASSDVERPASSEVERPASSEVERPASSEVERPASSEVERFLVEALSPFEMAHRGYREANAVLRRANDMLEAQSRRIAAALHDEASQLLTPLHLALAEAERQAPGAAASIAQMRGLLGALEDRLRGLAHELRPPMLEHLGLVPTLEILAEGISARWNVAVGLHASVDDKLPPSVETTLYRVVQEALTNVARHADATRAQVTLVRRSRAIVCSIADDGKGFTERRAAGESHTGLGLASINERVEALGGTVHLGAFEQGAGTMVTVEIPLEA